MVVKGAVASISTLGIVTANRPAAVQRCIASYIEHLQQHGRTPRLFIIDDSRRQEDATATKRIVTGAGRTYGGAIRYIGVREKADARRILERAGIDRPTIDFGLPARGHGFAPGANRNHLLLATAGDLLLTADDDTVCDTWSGSDDDSVAFAGQADPRRFEFFANRRQALAATQRTGVDLLGGHEQVLGRSLSDIAASAQSTTLDTACDHIVAGLKLKHDGYQVRVTSSGLAGDSAMRSPYRLLFSPTTTHHWTTIDERTFTRALTRRETRRFARRTTVTHQAATMMYSAGIDNRTVTPPFNPIGANEDGLFGVMLRLMAPTAFLAHIPVGIVHDSNRPSAYDRPHMPCVSETRIADLTIALLHEWTMTSAAMATPRARLKSLGKHLVALADMPVDECAARVVAASLNLWQHERTRLDELIAATPGLPAFWLRTLDKYRATFLRNAADPTFFIPIEVKRTDSPGRGFRRLQMSLGSLGRLMIAWPEIWAIARRERLYWAA